MSRYITQETFKTETLFRKIEDLLEIEKFIPSPKGACSLFLSSMKFKVLEGANREGDKFVKTVSERGEHEIVQRAPNRKERILSGIKSQNEPAIWEGRQGFWVQGDCVFIEAREPVGAINKYREELAAAKIACSHNLFCGSLSDAQDLAKPRGANKECSFLNDFVFFNNAQITFPVEVSDGKVVEYNISNFHCTGIAPSWEDAKIQVEKYGQGSLGTVGYFRNPSGMITCTSRFSHYLNQEHASH